MRPILFLCSALVLAAASWSSAQDSAYKPTAAELRPYEGTYASPDGPVMVGLSPRDNQLHAIVIGSDYILHPISRGVFGTVGPDRIEFVEQDGRVIGYRELQGDTALVKKTSSTPPLGKSFWYARGEGAPYSYSYAAPADRHDGIAVSTLAQVGLDPAPLHMLVSRITDNTYPGVDSVLIMKDGKLVFEEYFYGNNADTLHELRSATKSFTSALTGIAVRKGLIAGVDQPILPLMPEYNRETAGGPDPITIGDLLTQRSGLACDEDDPASPGFEVKIYPSHDWTSYILSLPMQWKPGTVGKYCSANTLLLDDILQHVSHQKLEDFARDNLFQPLGVTHFWWDFGANEKHKNDFGQAKLRSRDMAKFGQMYLNGGTWNGTRILSEDWVKQTLAVHSHVEDLDYGYMWWVEDMTVNGVTYRGYAAKGNGGQRIFLWPKIRMLAVVTASDYNRQSPANKLLRECVLAAVPAPKK